MTYIPGQVTLTTAPPVSASDIENERLARCRPADRSASATRAALANIVLECATSAARLVHAQDVAEAALLKHPNDLRRAREAVAAAQDEAAQYEARRAAMQATLMQREAAEAGAAADLARLSVAAEEKAAKFRAFLAKDYAKHAAAIAAGMQLEREAMHADMLLREAARAWPGVPYGRPDIPRAADGKAYSLTVSLPGHASPPVMGGGAYARQG